MPHACCPGPQMSACETCGWCDVGAITSVPLRRGVAAASR